MVDTSEQWILTRTGIEKRHIAGEGVATSDLATEAARELLAATETSAEDVEAILVCTVTPDMFFPSTACLVQDRLGARGAWGFDLVAACSGLLYGLSTGCHLVGSGTHRRVLVIGADTMSRIIDYRDRATCVLFGDGAGAFLLEPASNGDGGMIDFINEVDGSGGKFLNMPAGGSAMPASHETVDQRLHYVRQQGRPVYKFAVSKMYQLCKAVLDRNGYRPEDVDLLIPHQANRRIIVAVAERLGLPLSKAMINIDQYGNTTAGTIPIATRDAIDAGRLKRGDLVLMAAVGAGFTAGVSLWRWSF